MKQKDSLPKCEKEEKRARFTLLDRKPAVCLVAGAVVLTVAVTAGLTRPQKVEGAWEEMQAISLVSSAVTAAKPSAAESSCPLQSTVSQSASPASSQPVSSEEKPSSQAASSAVISSEPESEIHEGEPIPMAGASWDHTGPYEYVEMPVEHRKDFLYNRDNFDASGYFISSTSELEKVFRTAQKDLPRFIPVITESSAEESYLPINEYDEICEKYNDDFFEHHRLVLILNTQGSGGYHVTPFCKKYDNGNYIFGTHTVYPNGDVTCDMAFHAFFFELPKEVDSSKIKIQFTTEQLPWE